MRWQPAVLTCAVLVAFESHGQTSRPTLLNGVISYNAEDGQRRMIHVGRKCADLWVAPDESVITFIAIDKVRPATGSETEPFIEESSIYIARRSDDFKPDHLVASVPIDGRVWKVVRQPSLSPDLKTVYFSVPFTMTSWKLLSTSLRARSYTTIGNADSYCVVWGGEHSGALLMEIRRESNSGVRYPCYLRSKSGTLTKGRTRVSVGASENLPLDGVGNTVGVANRRILAQEIDGSSGFLAAAYHTEFP